MSIATMTGRWADRQLGGPGGNVSTPGDVRATAANTAGGRGVGHDEQPLDLLTAYIPVESITLYVSALSALGALKSAWFDGWKIYLIFGLIVTPLFTLLIAWIKQKQAGVKLGLAIRPLIFATVAFLAWAPAVPGLVSSDPGKVVAAFVAMAISRVLALADKLLS